MKRLAGVLGCVAATACGFSITPVPAVGDASTDGKLVDAAIDGPMTTCADAWLDLAWPSRKRLTIAGASIPGNTSEFPLLVDVVVTAARPDGGDIVFTQADGVSRLPHEIDRYDPGTGRLLAWVRLPGLAMGAPTTLYMYSGNAAAVNTQNAGATWAPDFTSVWHLRELPNGSAPQIMDSGAAARHLTSRGGMNVNDLVDGKIGGALDFDGANDGLDGTAHTVAATFTYEAWINPTSTMDWRCIINNHPAYSRWFGVFNQEADFWDGSSEYRRPASVNTNAWHHMVATYDGTSLRMYRNGVQQGLAQTLNFGAVTSGVQVGYTSTNISEWFTGRIDEVRVSRVARSPAYVAAAFANQDAPTTFVTVTATETCP